MLAPTQAAHAQVAEDTVIHFEAGLIGLPALTRFVLVERGPTPWWWLQSADVPGIALAVMDPLRACPGYRPLLSQRTLDEVGAASVDEVALLAVVVPFPDGGAHVNLLAPLVLHVPNRRGVQAVLEPGSYPLRHPFAG